MPEYMYSVIVVVVLIIVFGLWTWNKKNEVWKGELVKKKFTSGDEDSRTVYYLIFKTDEGKKKRFTTYDEASWAAWDEGDRAEKRKGEFFPVRI